MNVEDPGLIESGVDVFSILERACSVLSILGSIVVICTFSLSKAFHKPINRLVFYATFGNLMTNVATLMARSFIGNIDSFGCQFQAFLIQMFMPADAFWTLAMAVNVYLTFYFKFDAQRLRRMEIPYLLLCYGIPFVVALVLIFVRSPDKGRMYGNATLWCWISPKWDIFRIAIFYGPVWIVILITFFIYIRAGRDIYKKHKQLRDFSTSRHDPEPMPVDDLFSSTKTTEVFVTTEVIDKPGTIDLAPLGAGEPRRSLTAERPQKPTKTAYSVTISSNRPLESRGDMEGQVQTTITADRRAGAGAGTAASAAAAAAAAAGSATGDGLARVHTHTVTHGSTKPTLSTATSGTLSGTGTGTGTGTGGPNPLRRRAAYEANSATWSYTKCAILFFTAMLVTWIPSSANRVYSVIHATEASLPLEYMSSFVLPLQGFWNAIIYVVTSWAACKMFWEDTLSWWWSSCGTGARGGRGRGRGRLPDAHEMMHGPGGGGGGGGGPGGGSGGARSKTFGMMGVVGGRGGSKGGEGKVYETESMTELAGSSRPGSSGSPTVIDHPRSTSGSTVGKI